MSQTHCLQIGHTELSKWKKTENTALSILPGAGHKTYFFTNYLLEEITAPFWGRQQSYVQRKGRLLYVKVKGLKNVYNQVLLNPPVHCYEFPSDVKPYFYTMVLYLKFTIEVHRVSSSGQHLRGLPWEIKPTQSKYKLLSWLSILEA